MSDYELANSANAIRKLRIANRKLIKTNRFLEQEVKRLKREAEEEPIQEKEAIEPAPENPALTTLPNLAELLASPPKINLPKERAPDMFDLDKPKMIEFPY